MESRSGDVEGGTQGTDEEIWHGLGKKGRRKGA